MSKKFFEVQKPCDLKVYIGRFSPPHVGHEHVVRKAFGSSHNVLILIGSVNKPRTIKDPWTYEDRRDMWFKWFESEKGNLQTAGKGFLVMPVRDDPNEQRWIQNVQQEVTAACHALGLNERTARICLTGSQRDWTTYYLKEFPMWEDDFLPPYEDTTWGSKGELNATIVRDILFDDNPNRISSDCGSRISRPIHDYLTAFMKTPDFVRLKEEYDYIRSYKKQWSVAPYPPTFITVDSVVIQSGHVLLVQRKDAPGKGLWALPGGFVEQNELLATAALRELQEETGIKLTDATLELARQGYEPVIFDRPGRSLRGRTITVAYLYKLNDAKVLPGLHAGSDAQKARWTPLNEFEDMESKMFEDHYSIIKTMLSKI